MPKKTRQENQGEQSDRFKRVAQKLIDDGELNPIEGERAIDDKLRGVVLQVKRKKSYSATGT